MHYLFCTYTVAIR